MTNSEGNHGEAVKECYFYLDSTPTHSYMKYLYKYPQAEYCYSELVETNRRRSKLECEYKLLDTGILNEDRYFDVFIEYAKQSPEDILILSKSQVVKPFAMGPRIVSDEYRRKPLGERVSSIRSPLCAGTAPIRRTVFLEISAGG